MSTNIPFVGQEAALTYIAQYPAGATLPGPDPGVEPIGNVHSNAAGYAVIADQITATPEPASLVLIGIATAGFVFASRIRRRRLQN